VFSESPPVVGYGGWTGLSRLGAPPPQQHVRQIGEVVQPQHAVSSDEEQQQTDQREGQDEEDFGGFLSSSLASCVPPGIFVPSTPGGDFDCNCDCEPILQACAQHEP